MQNSVFSCAMSAALIVVASTAAFGTEHQRPGYVVESAIGQPETDNQPAFIAKHEMAEVHDERVKRYAVEDEEDRAIVQQSARASARQADYAEIGLWVSAAAALGTAWAAWAAAAAAKASEKAVLEARRSNEQAHKLFIAEHRPWLSVSAKLDNHLVWNETTIGAIIVISIENVSSTPATGAFFTFEAIPDPFIDPVPLLTEYCESIRIEQETRAPRGWVIFPGKSITVKHTVGVLKAEARKHTFDNDKFSMQIRGCVHYRIADGSVRYTGVLYTVYVAYDIPMSEGAGIHINNNNIDHTKTRIEPWGGGETAI